MGDDHNIVEAQGGYSPPENATVACGRVLQGLIGPDGLHIMVTLAVAAAPLPDVQQCKAIAGAHSPVADQYDMLHQLICML